MTTVPPALLPNHEGCWFDCARGIYIGEAVIDEAISFGWDPEGYEPSDFTPDGDGYLEAWDDAQRYLDALAPEGFWIGSNENGDFGMWAIDDEETSNETD